MTKKKQLDKPQMPKKPMVFDGGNIPVRLDLDLERFSNGSMRMCMEGATVSRGGKVVGQVNAALPTGVQVSIEGRCYYISAEALFNAGEAADKAYLASIGESGEAA